jgi:D,D-heptose 1,7-bisphosphate phosphatase
VSKNKYIQAVILCGGEGTRLGKITKQIPKPLIKINKKSFIDYQINHLKKFGFKKFLLLCKYKSKKFIYKYKNKKNIKIVVEKTKMNTGGALIKSIKKLDNNFLIYNGDTFADFNFNFFIENLKKSKVKNSIAVKYETAANRYDKVKFNNKSNLIEKIDKNINSNFIFSGFALLNRNSLRNIKVKKITFEKLILNNLIKNKNLIGFKIIKNVNFIDIGVKSDLKKSSKILNNYKNKKVVFFDRDGTINKDTKYLHKKKDFVWNRSFFKTINFLNSKNILSIVITNQSGVGRGYYSEKDVLKLHNWMNEVLMHKNSFIDDFFYAPYHDNSKKFIFSKKDQNMRKPNTGMIIKAKKKWGLNLMKSIIIGDSYVDELLAKNLKIKFLKVNYKTNLLKILKNNLY